MNHLMIDLETMATTPDAAILSIGACWFEPAGADLVAASTVDMLAPDDKTIFYRVVKLADQPGRVIDPDTVTWWMGQSAEARAEVFPPKDSSNALPLKTAMAAFQNFVGDAYKKQVWAQGSSFDIVIIEDIFRQYRQPIPWRFWNHRDTRTAYELASYSPPRESIVAHVAWKDAFQQAKQVQAAYAKVKSS